MPNIINIPSNYHFFKSLLFWLKESFSDELPHVKIFLPNRRSCREFSRLFIDQSQSHFLPEIKAISDLSFEDFFDFLPNEDAQEAIDELLALESFSKIDYLLLLAQEIQKLSLFGKNIDFEQAFKIAINLENLFNDIDSGELNFIEQITGVDDSNLSQHRQITIDFLKEFYVKIKNSSLKNNIAFSNSIQSLITQKFITLLDKYGSKQPLVIAGSSGSIPFVKKLIKAISKKNHVVLYGFKDEKEPAENHPQFFLDELRAFLDIDAKDIAYFTPNQFLLSPPHRQALLSLMTLQSQETIKWQNIEHYIDKTTIKKDLEDNITLIQSDNEIQEAQIIAAILEESCAQNKKAAIIATNDKLASLIALELKKRHLIFNDTRSFSIFNAKVIHFLFAILELIESDFNAHNLLALLKNPLCVYAKEKKLMADFERLILRQDREDKGIQGIQKQLKSLDRSDFSTFFNDLTAILSTFDDANLGMQIISLIEIAEKLAQNTWQNLLINEPAQIEIFELCEKLKNYVDVKVNRRNLLNTYKTLFSQITYFEKALSDVPIQILSTIEARLLNHDLIVISSLNEGDFPQLEKENWLGKKIKKDLKIDKALKRVGQNAYDFCNYLSNESVVLTRSKTLNSSVTIESPFLLKLKTICAKIGANIDQSASYLNALEEEKACERQVMRAPNPKPDVKYRPKKISITDINKLLSNPYDIYARKVLKLEKLNKIDFEPGYAEFGSFIHEALEKYLLSSSKQDQSTFLKEAEKIFTNYFTLQEAKLIWWPKFENIFNDFLLLNKDLNRIKNHVEVPASIHIKKHEIRGKIDRVVIKADDSIEIIDYKTGQAPSKKDVFSGKDPQLTIAALMLLEGITDLKLEASQMTKLSYWKLSASANSEIKKICQKNEEITILMAAAKAGMEKLIDYFADAKNGYLALESKKRSDYEHLIRQEEWA